MLPKLRRFVCFFLCLGSLNACNLYQGFAGLGDATSIIEEARKCLHEGDYACAVANYNLLPEGEERNQRLCRVYLAQAGLGLTALINIIAEAGTGQTLMGQLAQALVPYTAEKETAALNAATTCDLLTANPNTDFDELLKVLGQLTNCAIRIAKTDEWVATSDDPASCNSTTAGDRDGVIEANDIAEDPSQVLAANNRGMCQFDVDACLASLQSAATTSSSLSSGLDDIKQNIDAIPGNLKTTGIGAALARQAIVTVLAP